jgi:ribokinase
VQRLNVDLSASPYRAMIGVGGIGTGRFVSLHGNHTLGREESRAVRFLDYRDYCKLHIISHYVKTLLGPNFPTVLIGKVGDDAVGHSLMTEMRQTGLDVRNVEISPGLQTLNAICFIYPDGSGGNMTTKDSACSHVDANDVTQREPEFAVYKGHGIALAAPEVPLSARMRLLQLATAYDFLRVATFVSAEIQAALDDGMIDMVDVLSINRDEAAAVAGLSPEQTPIDHIVDSASRTLLGINPGLKLCITAGKDGSWTWDGPAFAHVPAVRTEAVSTAGAGDAFIASIIVGLVANLTLAQAQTLATLVAALSVTSPHTIHPALDRRALAAFIDENALQPVPALRNLLQG